MKRWYQGKTWQKIAQSGKGFGERHFSCSGLVMVVVVEEVEDADADADAADDDDDEESSKFFFCIKINKF